MERSGERSKTDDNNMIAEFSFKAPGRVRIIHHNLVLWIWRYGLSLGAFLGLWFLLVWLVDNPFLMPSPLKVLPEIWKIIATGELIDQISVSLRRLVIGYSLAASAGLLLGILMTASPLVEKIIDPVIELIRPVSGIAWIPLFLAIFGVGDVLPIAVIFYAAFFPFVVNTYAAFKRVPPHLVNAAQSLGASRVRVLREVVLPAALPSILTGARIALAFAWASIVAAELIGSSKGVGFQIEWNRKLLMTHRVLAWIAIVGLLGFLTDRVAIWIEQKLTPWRKYGIRELEDAT